MILSRLLLAIPLALASSSTLPEPVVTPKIPKTFTEHGHTRVDDYFWLSNPADSAVLRHLRGENEYTHAMLRHTEVLQKTLLDELKARVEQRYTSLPVRKHGYWYYLRYESDAQYPLYCRRRDAREASEEVYLDAPRLAKGHGLFIVRGYQVSPDNLRLAYGVDTTGDRRATLYVREAQGSGEPRAGIENTSGDYQWANGDRTLYYVLNDHTVRPYRVMKHVVGSDLTRDTAVYTESDSTFDVSLSASRDHRFIFIESGSTLTSECRILDASSTDAAPVLVQRRRRDVLYSVEDAVGDSLYILTNRQARNFRLVSAPIAAPQEAHWRDVVPHRTDALLEDAAIFSRFLVIERWIGGLPRIRVVDRHSGEAHDVEFGEEAYQASMYTATDDADLDSIRYVYSSLTTPKSEYRYGLATRDRELLKRDSIGGGYDPSLYQTRRLWATATDGTKVPISVVFKKSLFRGDGSNPLLLYAYGSYGFSTEPSFNRSVVSLLDRGFVYAIAHIRGGQEMGRAWYEDGKLMNKKHTFTDFVDCARYLVREKYTAPERLFAMGGSAGGMLMGAVANLAPDLFRGIVAQVPWMDVITDMLNSDLPLTTLEYDEWGSPAVKQQYEYMLSWSPYDNVRDAEYPAVLATGSLNDTQVPYYSPAKWVAKVREHNRGKNPVLFKVNLGAGHSGQSGRFERLRETALFYAFMLSLVGAGL